MSYSVFVQGAGNIGPCKSPGEGMNQGLNYVGHNRSTLGYNVLIEVKDHNGITHSSQRF